MKLEFYQLKELYMPIIGIIIGELMVLHGNIQYAIALRLIVLLVIIFKIITKTLESETYLIFQSFILLILLQLIIMSTPRLFGNDFLKNQLLIYGAMILPILLIIKNVGKNFRKQFYYITFAILTGILSTMFEYRMLTVYNLSFNGNIVVIFILILVSTSFILSYTKYWNNIFDICSNSLIPIYIMIMISKIK